ncbi:MAG: phosphoribosylformylglycinamidine synthase I [Nitrospirota bacterium]
MYPKILILTGYGINCDEETKYAFELAGGIAEIIHINDLIDQPEKIKNYQIMAFPGGFSYGDDTGSGNALANKIKSNLMDNLLEFIMSGNLIIGICNGFQVLVNLGLLPAIQGRYGDRKVALTYNITARFECRWVDLKNESDRCVFTRGIELIHVPVAHGEGNFYAEEETLKELKEGGHIVFRYIKPDEGYAKREFPFNPNGSLYDIAGICDETGRVFGMMPHPERYLAFTNRDNWALHKERYRREGKAIPQEGDGIAIFMNAVCYFR